MDYGCQEAQHKVIIKENEIVADKYKWIAFWSLLRSGTFVEGQIFSSNWCLICWCTTRKISIFTKPK